MFYFLAQLDFPTANLFGPSKSPFLYRLGKMISPLGDGLTLALIPLAIAAVGYFTKSQKLKMLGFHFLLAHALAGLFTQILKHSLGRPRPLHMNKGPWEIGPSLVSGYDSFPSGHSSSSFAVATVLAFYFPTVKILWFGLAAFVAMCRVPTGYHFPTDVLGGLLLGVGTGLAVVYTKNQWQEIGYRTLAQGLPWLITAFGLVWILVPHRGIELEPNLSLVVGLILIVVGLGLRLRWIRACSIAQTSSNLKVPTWPRLLMGLGLATSTGSLIIVGAGLLAGIIWWLGTQSESLSQDYTSNKFISGLSPIWTEALLGIGMFLLALLSFSILPI
jgi:undecaprenyl-diphosphatase